MTPKRSKLATKIALDPNLRNVVMMPKDADRPTLGFLTQKKIIEESVPIFRDGDSNIGECVNDMLGEALEKGDKLLSFTIEFSEEGWNEMVERHRVFVQGRSPAV